MESPIVVTEKFTLSPSQRFASEGFEVNVIFLLTVSLALEVERLSPHGLLIQHLYSASSPVVILLNPKLGSISPGMVTPSFSQRYVLLVPIALIINCTSSPGQASKSDIS